MVFGRDTDYAKKLARWAKEQARKMAGGRSKKAAERAAVPELPPVAQMAEVVQIAEIAQVPEDLTGV